MMLVAMKPYGNVGLAGEIDGSVCKRKEGQSKITHILSTFPSNDLRVGHSFVVVLICMEPQLIYSHSQRVEKSH